MAKDLRELRDALRQFAADRDWDQHHSPKNLAAALVVEAADLLASAKDKMRVNAEKYPVKPARSTSGKYTEL